MNNPVGLNGIEFIEFAADRPDHLAGLFGELGLANTMSHRQGDIKLYEQNDVRFMVNCRQGSAAQVFHDIHGAGVSAVAWRVQDAQAAWLHAIKNGARQMWYGDYQYDGGHVPAIEGIGGSLIYFIDDHQDEHLYQRLGFARENSTEVRNDVRFLAIDHFTNNICSGRLHEQQDFYRRIFAFNEDAFFNVKGEHTGFKSSALRSPCGKFSIPVNEGYEDESQVNEFIDKFNGEGVQHIALLTDNMVDTLRKLQGSSFTTLEMYPEYYDEVFARVPSVREDHEALRQFHVLLDGDEQGYLLQIFTHSVIGPMSFEFIQRHNNRGFGEGNFAALFRAAELDQKRRGVLSQDAS